MPSLSRTYISHLDYDSLRRWVVLASCTSFEQASRRLGVSDATLYRLLNSLEKELKTPLIQQVDSRIQLTHQGKQAFQEACHSLYAIHDWFNDPAKLPLQPPSPGLDVAILPYTYILDDVQAWITAGYRDPSPYALNFHLTNPIDLHRWLTIGEYDAGLSWLTFLDPVLCAEKLGECPFVIVGKNKNSDHWQD